MPVDENIKSAVFENEALNEYKFVPPKWVYCFIGIIIVVGVTGYFYYSNYYKAIINYKKSITSVASNDYDEAERYINIASSSFPNSKEIEAFKEYIIGIRFYYLADTNNSLMHLKKYQEFDDQNNTVNSLVLMFEISRAFDLSDYSKMEEYARVLNKINPGEPLCMLQLASSIACKYVVDGVGFQYSEAKELVGEALKIDSSDEMVEYSNRILYRLEKKEIITQEEYILRKEEGRL